MTPRIKSSDRRITGLVLVTTLLALTGAGCVTTGTYNQKVAELEKTRDAHDRAAAEREKKDAERMRVLEAQISDRDARIAALTTERDGLRKQLDEAQAKLDAIALIERNLTDRPGTKEGRKP